MDEIFKYFHYENVYKGTTATAIAIFIATVATVSLFTKTTSWPETLLGYGISTGFLFAGPKRETPKDETTK